MQEVVQPPLSTQMKELSQEQLRVYLYKEAHKLSHLHLKQNLQFQSLGSIITGYWNSLCCSQKSYIGIFYHFKKKDIRIFQILCQVYFSLYYDSSCFYFQAKCGLTNHRNCLEKIQKIILPFKKDYDPLTCQQRIPKLCCKPEMGSFVLYFCHNRFKKLHKGKKGSNILLSQKNNFFTTSFLKH